MLSLALDYHRVLPFQVLRVKFIDTFLNEILFIGDGSSFRNCSTASMLVDTIGACSVVIAGLVSSEFANFLSAIDVQIPSSLSAVEVTLSWCTAISGKILCILLGSQSVPFHSCSESISWSTSKILFEFHKIRIDEVISFLLLDIWAHTKPINCRMQIHFIP